MKMNGILHVVDFKTEQIVAAIQPKDYWDDMRHWELKNNIDTLQFTTFDGTDQAVTFQQQNLILKQVRDGRIVPYVISNEVEKDSKDRSVTVHAAGAWVLLAKAGIIRPQRIESKTLNEFMDMALLGTKWKRGRTEYAGFHTMTIDEFIDPLTFLKKIASLFGLEIQYRVEVVGSQVVGWYVDMVKKRGRETGKEVTLGKDLVSVRRIEHSRDICTALVGFVRGEGDKLITVESINNGLPYITDSDAFQRWSENGQHKFGFYTPETEEQNMTPQRLLTLMNTELKKRVNASVSYEVEAADISKVFGLSHEEINEGDTIRIKDTGFTPKLYLEARAIAADESFTDPTKNKYTFGDYREIMDPNEELRKMYNRILSTLGSKANKELLEQLEKLVQETDEKVEIVQKESQAAKELAEKVQENLENYQTKIYEGANPPTTGLEAGKTLWQDISNGKPGILKKWNGEKWEILIPDYGEDIKELDEKNAQFETTVNGLKSDVEQLSITTDEHGKQIREANTKIEQNSQAIEAKVEIKDVEDYVGGIGSINLIRNAKLTNGVKYWKLHDATRTHIDITVVKDGINSFKTVSTGNTSNHYYGAEQTVELREGETIVASAYFRTDNPAGLDQGAALEIKFLGSGGLIKLVSEELKLAKDQWLKVYKSAIAPSGTVKAIFRYQVRRNGTLWMAQPMLQVGTIPSSFLENPNDFVDKDKIMEELADKVATEQYTKKVTELERSISANEKGVAIISEKHETFVNDTFDAYVKETGSKLQVLDEGILAQVKKGDIIAAINMSAEKITIDVAKLAINADTMVKWLTAKGIDTNLIRISGDKILIDKNGVTIKMLDFLFEDERGLKTTVQAKRNLVIDHDFSSVPKQVMPGNTAFSWFETGRFWRKNGSVVIENDTLAFSYERMVNATRVDKNSYVETTVKNGVHPGNIYTVSAHFRAATINGQRVTAKPVIQILYVKYDDNVHYTTWYEVSKSFDAPSTFYGDIQRRAFTITIPASYRPGEHAVIIRLKAEGDVGQGTAVCVSGVEMVTGKYPSMYSWQAQSGSVYGGIMPIDGLEFGDSQGTINVAQDRKTFDIGGTLETKFHNNIRATQGVNLGGNEFQGWGHVRFTDGNQGIGFYVHNSNGWFFNRLG
ncbi:phage tail spike protein [Bacillus cereus group sp. BfR-BA-01522]|uniref:phage tail spike protein n=1 Tax=Bacillus cereus group sp. BfR-BA-01522 TaxID=2920370 RepID=UPI002412462C